MSASKRAKVGESTTAAAPVSMEEVERPGLEQKESVKMLAQLITEDGESTGPQLELPSDVTPKQLQILVNKLLEQVRGPREI